MKMSLKVILVFLFFGIPAISYAQTANSPELGSMGSFCDLESCTYVKNPALKSESLPMRNFYYFANYDCTTSGEHVGAMCHYVAGDDRIKAEILRRNKGEKENAKGLVYQYIVDEFGRFLKTSFPRNQIREEFHSKSDGKRRIVASAMSSDQNIMLTIECVERQDNFERLPADKQISYWQCDMAKEWYEKLPTKKAIREARCEELTHVKNPKNTNCSYSSEAVVNFVKKMKQVNLCVDGLD